MSSGHHLNLKGTVARRADALLLLSKPGDAALVSRGELRALVLACPCGCGIPYPINLDDRIGPAWTIYKSRNHEISVYPSVWRTDGCKSHYIIWRNKILLFGEHAAFDESDEDNLSSSLMEKVYQLLGAAPRSTLELSNELGAVPWDVLAACNALRKQGLVIKGRGKFKGSFRRKRSSKSEAKFSKLGTLDSLTKIDGEV